VPQAQHSVYGLVPALLICGEFPVRKAMDSPHDQELPVYGH
jgi:hypothetical protein